MSAGVSALYRQLLQTVRSLPRDPLRPTLQLNETLEATVNRAFGIKQVETVNSSTSEALPLKLAEHVSAEDEALASKALQALKDLSDDKALHAVRRSTSALRPVPRRLTRSFAVSFDVKDITAGNRSILLYSSHSRGGTIFSGEDSKLVEDVLPGQRGGIGWTFGVLIVETLYNRCILFYLPQHVSLAFAVSRIRGVTSVRNLDANWRWWMICVQVF
jgi:hypothetical protein